MVDWALLGARIREKMGTRTQVDAAHSIGITQPHLNAVLKGGKKGHPSLETVVAVCRAWKVSADYLLDLPSAPEGESREVTLPGQPEPFVAIRLLASQLGAGEAIEQLDRFSADEYVFRPGFLKRVVGGAKNALMARVSCRSMSMEDTIRRGSIVLIDRRPVLPETFLDRKLYVVRAGPTDGGATVKRVTLDDSRHVVCLSDNPSPEFKPFVIHLAKGEPLSRVILGRVVWWGTEDRIE